MKDEARKTTNPDANPDAITGAPRSHPVGTGVGAASAGAAGAAIGSIGGPVGTAVGAVVGAVAGGLAGKGVAEAVNPTAEDAYWRQNFSTRPYVSPGSSYDDYQVAYRSGWEWSSRYPGRRFEEVEPDLRRDWESSKGGKARLEWERAKNAVRDAWNRVESRVRGNDENRKVIDESRVETRRGSGVGTGSMSDTRDDV
jgi:hypothetical protein